MTATTMPRWLSEALIDKGILTAQGLTRTARVRTHPCGVPCLAGIDDNGLDAWCELAEITTLAEAHALLDDRTTYRIHAAQLVRRDQWHIRAHPASDEPTLVEHRCHASLPADWIAPLPALPAPAPRKETSACPF